MRLNVADGRPEFGRSTQRTALFASLVQKRLADILELCFSVALAYGPAKPTQCK